MASEHAPRLSTECMSHEDYRHCLRQLAAAESAEAVERIRDDLTRRWSGDPVAQNLAETLYAHRERLAAREHAMRLERTRAESPSARRQGLRSGAR